jgi:hypothetical protein
MIELIYKLHGFLHNKTQGNNKKDAKIAQTFRFNAVRLSAFVFSRRATAFQVHGFEV